MIHSKDAPAGKNSSTSDLPVFQLSLSLIQITIQGSVMVHESKMNYKLLNVQPTTDYLFSNVWPNRAVERLGDKNAGPTQSDEGYGTDLSNGSEEVVILGEDYGTEIPHLDHDFVLYDYLEISPLGLLRHPLLPGVFECIYACSMERGPAGDPNLPTLSAFLSFVHLMRPY
ncbi:hypothetical protein BDV93DRAFT_516456 [Ceratobasidium sp. AG-I]|nr:hypothetical protein BDV93DRAFT_516456 [Ceratobasidium sp. AG-I]